MNYLKIHNSIIERAKNRTLIGYSEKHHIVPKCMGGRNYNDNLVYLTAKEHYLIHRLLISIYPSNDKLFYAFWAMCGFKEGTSGKRHITSPRIYERTRIELSARASKKMKENNPFKGKKHSEKSLIKMRNFAKTKPINPKAVAAMKLANTGTKKSDHVIKGISERESVPVIKLDLKGNFIEEFESMTKANLSLGIERYDTNISLCTKTGRSARGYLWVRKSEYDPSKVYKYTGRQGIANHKKVYQYDLNWILIKEWECIQYAADNFNMSESSLQQCLKDEEKRTCKGFKWSRTLK